MYTGLGTFSSCPSDSYHYKMFLFNPCFEAYFVFYKDSHSSSFMTGLYIVSFPILLLLAYMCFYTSKDLSSRQHSWVQSDHFCLLIGAFSLFILNIYLECYSIL